MTNSKDSLTLKPCPFCGGNAYFTLSKKMHCQLHGDVYQMHIVQCRHKDAMYMPETNNKLPHCDVKPSVSASTKEQAAELWNRRTA